MSNHERYNAAVTLASDEDNVHVGCEAIEVRDGHLLVLNRLGRTVAAFAPIQWRRVVVDTADPAPSPQPSSE